MLVKKRITVCVKVVVVFLLFLGLTGCDTTVKEPIKEEKINSTVNSSIVEVNECSFEISNTLLGSYHEFCTVYLDKLTKSYYAKFNSTYNGIIIKLVNSDGTPKLYSKKNKNELVLVEQDNFYIFEDTDTGVQYVTTKNYSDYVVRGTATGGK